MNHKNTKITKEKMVGHFAMMEFVLEIVEQDGRLLAAVPGVPPGYEIILEPQGDSSWVMRGGPMDGAPISFEVGEDVTRLEAGHFKLEKVTPAALAEMNITERLLAPEVVWTAEKTAAFQGLLEVAAEQSDGSWIDYQLPFPKHEFVQFAMARDLFIFHGSNNRAIAEFAPVRNSVELNDETGRGNLQAVYGTHDGLWAMFFAIVDRSRLKGSIRNGVIYFHNASGQQLPVYNFSINQDLLTERPYTAGALYFLPRQSFTRLEMTPGVFANEWASTTAVRPLAKLALDPKDFPFLERMGGHDDEPMLRMGVLERQIQAAAVSAESSEDRFWVKLPAEADIVEHLGEYQTLLGQMMPGIELTVSESAAEVQLAFAKVPPAVQEMLRKRYEDLLN